MQHTLCPSCEGWQAHPEDRVCGNCGDILLQANVDIIPAVVFKDVTPPNDIQILATKKHGNLDGTDFIWKRVRDDQEIPIPDILFPPTSPIDTPVDIEFPFDLLVTDRNQKDEWKLIHRIMEDCEPVLGTLNVGVKRPELVLTQTDILLKGEQVSVMIHLTNIKGVNFNISELFITSPDRAITRNLPAISSDLRGLTLREGEILDIPLDLSPTLLKQIHDLPDGLSFLLNIKSLDLPGDVVVEPPPEFRIRVPKPALPTIKANNNRIKVLQNGRLSLPLSFENRGGEPCIIQSFDLEIKGHRLPIESINIYKEIAPFTLDIGEGKERLLRTSLQESDLPEVLPVGTYLLNVSVTTEDNKHPPQTPFELEVVEPKPYEGIIVIDFGTTASAAACYLRKGNPVIISLSDDRKSSYIPTAIAYYQDSNGDLKYSIGEKALEKFHQLPANKVCFLDNLKWRLKETASILLPDQSEKQWWEATADYLNAIKQRIEDHPSVVATINNVCITQPARFDPQLSNLLSRAYQLAGMDPLVIYSDGQPVKTISESWPASMLCLKGKEILQWQQYYLGSKWAPKDEQYLWLNFDMGGGSTDLSLMTIDIDGYDHMHLEEIASDGDNDIAGNCISSLIYKHISFIDSENRSKINLNNYPILLPWDDSATDITDKETAIINGHRVFENIIFPLQEYKAYGSQGLIQESFAIFYDESTEVQQDLTKLWLDDSVLEKSDIKDLILNFNETVKYHVEENPHQSLSVTLKSIHGAENEFIPGQVTFNATTFIEDFITEVSIPLYNKVRSLVQKASNNSDERKLLILATGRGELFPLIDTILDSFVVKMIEEGVIPDTADAKNDVQGIIGEKAKTIVCGGACHIGHLLTQGKNYGDDIKFKPLPAPKFGFLKGRDRVTGKHIFQELHNGIISSNDGWLFEKYPVRPGKHNLSITFCQNLDGEETFIPKDDNRYTIQGSVDFQAEDAKTTYLLVRMLDDGQLEASIGISPIIDESDDSTSHGIQTYPVVYEASKDSPDCESWEKQLLGHYQLLPNTIINTKSKVEQKDNV